MVEEAGIPKDLIEIFTKSVEDMTDEELLACYEQVRILRKAKISMKRKDPLDQLLKNLNPELAKKVLARLEESEEKEGGEEVKER